MLFVLIFRCLLTSPRRLLLYIFSIKMLWKDECDVIKARGIKMWTEREEWERVSRWSRVATFVTHRVKRNETADGLIRGDARLLIVRGILRCLPMAAFRAAAPWRRIAFISTSEFNVFSLRLSASILFQLESLGTWNNKIHTNSPSSGEDRESHLRPEPNLCLFTFFARSHFALKAKEQPKRSWNNKTSPELPERADCLL